MLALWFCVRVCVALDKSFELCSKSNPSFFLLSGNCSSVNLEHLFAVDLPENFYWMQESICC